MIKKDTYTPMFTAALFTIDKIWKQPKCPTTDESLPFATTCMDLQSIRLSEINQIEQDNYCMWNKVHFYVESKI